jgi:hypothetical protein
MMNYSYSGDDRRQSGRSDIAMHATLRASGCHRLAVELKDISAVGFRCEYASELRIGEILWLKFDDFEAMEVEVIRRDGYIYGLTFVHPLYDAVLDEVVRRYGRVIA